MLENNPFIPSVSSPSILTNIFLEIKPRRINIVCETIPVKILKREFDRLIISPFQTHVSNRFYVFDAKQTAMNQGHLL
jgi:hypothetical protein